MQKEIRVGGWYYRMMGYGGSDSQYCCVLRSAGRRTEGGMFSLFGGPGGAMKALPESEVFVALDERGREFEVSANDLAANGHIGIGTLGEPGSPHRASMWGEDARLLVETGAYSEAEIEAEFPYAFRSFAEEAEARGAAAESLPMTERQAEMLRAAKAANDEKARREAEEESRRFAAAVEKARARFAYVPCPRTDGRWLRTGEVGRNLRAVLKREFPGVKFVVRTSSYSGGDSARVRWTEGPTEAAVNGVADAFETERSAHAGDYWDHVETAVSAVCGGFSFVHYMRDYEPETRECVARLLDERLPRGGYNGSDSRRRADVDRKVYELLSRTEFPRGGYEIEGVEWDDGKGEWFIKFSAKGGPVPPADGPEDGNGGAAWNENEEKHGVEVRFPGVPGEDIRSELKAAGFRWSRFSKCWYAKADEAARGTARAVVERFNGGMAAA